MALDDGLIDSQGMLPDAPQSSNGYPVRWLQRPGGVSLHLNLPAGARPNLSIILGRSEGTPMPGQHGAVTALPLLFQMADSLPQRQ